MNERRHDARGQRTDGATSESGTLDGRRAVLLALGLSLAVVLGTVASGFVAPAGTALAAEEARSATTASTELSGCTTITESGEYVLAGDVTNASPTRPRSGLGACIAIRATDAPGRAVYAVRNSTVVGERVRLGDASLSFAIRDAALDPTADAPPLPTDRQVVGDPLLAVPTGADARLSLALGYDDAAVERARTTEGTLALWRFDAGEAGDGPRPARTPSGTSRRPRSGT